MDNFTGIILCLLLGFGPALFFAWLVYWVDRYEKEPRLLLGIVFLWGAIVAAGAAFLINTVLGIGIYLFTGSESLSDLGTGSIIAPIIEESLKGLAVLIVFLVFRHEFDSILDGIVYAAITALGFAATENAYYMYTYGFAEEGLAGIAVLFFVRVILVGWQHPFYTAFTGIGLAISRLSRNMAIKISAPVIGWMVAVFAHALHNTLAGILPGLLGLTVTTLFDWTGWLAMLGFIIWALLREKRWISAYLREEVNLGIISPEQYRVACSAWAQSLARSRSLFSSKYQATNRFYQLTAELAYKKHQFSELGEASQGPTLVESMRAELMRLSPLVRT